MCKRLPHHREVGLEVQDTHVVSLFTAASTSSTWIYGDGRHYEARRITARSPGVAAARGASLARGRPVRASLAPSLMITSCPRARRAPRAGFRCRRPF